MKKISGPEVKKYATYDGGEEISAILVIFSTCPRLQVRKYATYDDGIPTKRCA